ncbi:MAG: DUF1801 domain-containing protein [Xanthomonadales bacterium]|nr:DUF1801 domain-containing protein [Xanthomonadales bacterium]
MPRPGKTLPEDGRVAVEAFLATLDAPRRATVQAVRRLVLALDPAIGESIKWNAPSFSAGRHFATFNLRQRDGVALILHGDARARPPGDLRAAIDDPASLLRWLAADRAMLVFEDAGQVQARAPALAGLIRAWRRAWPA